MIPLLASLIWFPSFGSGLKAEFLLKSTSPTVISVINTELNGDKACYMAIEGLLTETPRVYVYNDTTGDWLGDGNNCKVKVKKEEGWVRLIIEFNLKWKGKKIIFVSERGGADGEPYRAGVWEVKDEVPPLPPVVPYQMVPPSVPGEKGERGLQGERGEQGIRGPQGVPGPLPPPPYYPYPIVSSDETRLTQRSDGSYAYSNGPVYRNGILMTRGEDYTTSLTGIHPSPAAPWLPTDIVIGLTFNPLSLIWSPLKP